MEIIYICLIFLVIAVVLLVIAARRRGQKFSKRDLNLIHGEWHQINKKVQSQPNNALMEADRLLDFVLKRLGYTGSLGDKLKKAEKEFSNVDAVWSAHKLRNKVAHEVGFSVSQDSLNNALKAFKQAFFDLGVL